MATVLSALLISNCPQSLFISERSCAAHNVQTATCSVSFDARKILNDKNFELLILDFDLVGSAELLAMQPKDIHGCPSTIICLNHDPKAMIEAHRKQAHYCLT